MALTARQAETAKPADKDYKLTDAHGLYLLVKTSGSKYWQLKYRFGGKERKLSIGVYPAVSLAQARSKREEARSMIAEGKDPSYEKQAQKRAHNTRTATTFKAIADEWFAHKSRQWSEGYLAEQVTRIETKICPVIGLRPVSEITPVEVLHCLKAIENEGKIETLRKTRQTCVNIFAYAIVTGRATANPADYLNTALLSPQSDSHRSLCAEQLPDFLSDLHRAVEQEHLMALATRLLLLTVLRTGELRYGTWDEIDLDNALWDIPKERMKKRRRHVVPLSRQALDILKRVKDLTADCRSPYIFPGFRRHDQPRDAACIREVLKKIGWNEYATPHGFRHTFSTLAHDAGFNTDWVELQLAHVDKNSIRGTYNHALYLDDRRVMMQWYADLLDGQVADVLT